jgi:hypothetical protein
MTGDEITLTIPREESFHSVAHLVVGGIAVRLNLTFENLDDLEVALDTLLERARSDGDLTVAVRIREDTVHTVIGPFTEDVRDELKREAGDDVTLRRVLETVVDAIDLTERDDGHWVALTKTVRRVEPSS